MIYHPGKSYSLLSDELIEALRIEILAPGKGLWRFSDDPPEKIRRTVFTPKIKFEDLIK